MKIKNTIAPSDITIIALNVAIAEVCSHIHKEEFIPHITLLSTPNYYAQVRFFCYNYDKLNTPISINTSEKGQKWGVRIIAKTTPLVETWTDPVEIWIDTQSSYNSDTSEKP